MYMHLGVFTAEPNICLKSVRDEASGWCQCYVFAHVLCTVGWMTGKTISLQIPAPVITIGFLSKQ